jgi:hypothetical protein
MRRGVWVVLGLVGFAPIGALAQQVRQPSAEQARAPREVSNEALQQQLTELWQAFRVLQGEVVLLREQVGVRPSAPAVGGSGQAAGTASAGDSEALIIVEMPARGERRASDTAPEQRPLIRRDSATGGSGLSPSQPQQRRAPDEQEVLVGTVRSVAGGRLLMEDPSHRVYEFDLSEQTRLLGPDGAPLRRQPLPEGTQVMAVTQGGEVRDRVLTLQVLVNPLQPSP